MRRRRLHAAGRLRRGYVFPLALWTIAIVAVLLGAAYTVMSAANATLARMVEREAALADFRAVETQMLRLLLTEPMGLSDLRVGGMLDPDPISGGFGIGGDGVSATGAPYRVDGENGPVIVRLVAANGLLSLTDDPGPAAEALLLALGRSRPDARRLAARLADFVDEDDLRQLGGAEADDYPEGRRPRNAPLGTASDACGALGWAEEVALCADPRMMDLFAFAGGPSAMSARLVPEYWLHLLLGDDTPAVERAMDALEDRDRLVLYEDLGIEGLDALADNSAIPGPSFLIVTHRPAAEFVQLTRIDLTMANLYKPYEIAFSYVVGGSIVEGAFHVEEVDALDQLPQAD
ncbi:type II secretion system protein GspK [Maricaulis sp.]|uniref:type II secretion system protein GspK n=1 Tax=Maricaulis sp. TaxID=1486257 RepID=UPI00261115D0|nr:type II secretion system protein GspK [Maricaulis sp.]